MKFEHFMLETRKGITTFMLYKIVSTIAQSLLKGRIKGKKFFRSEKILYYLEAQHLGFLFQNRIKYELNIFNSARSYINNSKIIFDIGANIGQYAILMSEIVGEKGVVYSFEPDPKNFTFLQFNRNMNQCDNLICINHGVGDENKEMEFYRDTRTGGRMGSFIKTNVGENFQGFQTKQKIVRLDTLIEMYGEPDFIKVDVEGFELEVLKGLSFDLINTVWLVEVRENTKDSVFEYFKNHGYKCQHIENGNILVNHSYQIPEFANLLFTKSIA